MARPVVLKDAIYNAALKLFGEKGLAETSIRDIARQASVSEGSMYRHWPSKLALGWDIYKTNLEQLADLIQLRLRDAHTPSQQVRAVVATFYELFDDDPSLFRFLLLNQHELWPRLDETRDNPVHLWEQLVRQWWTEGNHHAVSLVLMTSITLGMILQPAVSCIYGTITVPMGQLVDDVTAEVCQVLGVSTPVKAQPLLTGT